jgi:hypothetical protein
MPEQTEKFARPGDDDGNDAPVVGIDEDVAHKSEAVARADVDNFLTA